MNPKYSIIIPHHNSSDTLIRLVNSIPEDERFQIIIVDDNSDEIEIDKISIVNQSNVEFIWLKICGGAGVARTKGLQYAKGTWIMFADSDDYYMPDFDDTVERLITENYSADIIIFNIDSNGNNSLQGKRYYNYIFNFNGTEESWVDVKYRTWTPWAKVFRRTFIEEHQLYFEARKKGNDCYFVLNAMVKAKSIIIDKTEIYHLSYSPNSLSHTKNDSWEYMFDVYDLWLWRYSFFREHHILLWEEYNIFYLLAEIKKKFGWLKMLSMFFHSFTYRYNYILLFKTNILK